MEESINFLQPEKLKHKLKSQIKMKKIFLLIFFLLFILSEVEAQTQLAIRIIDGSGNPVTGLTDANIKFRKSPYGAGDVLTITVTESGSQGNYICTGFTTFQPVKLFINDVEQAWFGEQLSGDPANTFMSKINSVIESINGNKTFTGTLEFTGYVTFSGTAVSMYYPQINTSSSWYIAGTPALDASLVWKSWVVNNFISSTGFADSMFIIRSNKIIVDDRLAANITGLQYNNIKEAMDWIHNNGSPGANTRWTVYILPSHITATGYDEDFYWYDYIDLVGLGQVYISNTTNIPPYSIFIRSGSNYVKAENINFYSYDATLTINLIDAVNCNFKVELDNYSPELDLQNCQLKNSGIYVKGGATCGVTGANRIINCYGNTNPSWSASDKVYSYSYVIGDDMSF